MAEELDGTHEITHTSAHDEKGDTLLSLASHELRTPLSIIKWYSEMLLDGDCGELNEDQSKYLKTIQASNQRAIDLIRSLLNVSRLDLGTFSITPESVDLRVLVKSVIEDYKTVASEKNVHIEELYESTVQGSVPNIQVDKHICVVLLRSLLSNAISFSNSDGKVVISVKDVKQGEEHGSRMILDDSLLISVSDNGIGIPTQEQDKIFTKLFKASNAQTDDRKGAGLGLYVVSLILSKTGGEIWFVSEQNIGTTFYIALPMHGMPEKAGTTNLD